VPGFGGTGKASLLRDNQQKYLFQQETNVTGRASIALQLERINRSYYPWGVSFQVAFTNAAGAPADPGSFEIDIQTSDVDQDAQYCTINSWVNDASLNASFVGRIELPSFYAKFVRAFVKTLTNSVYITVLVTR
jgi:hypothetical protein